MASQVQAVIDEKKKILIGYIPVGFPTLQDSIDAAIAMLSNGVDVLELGVPYSDPVMDGLVIQQATQTALAAGFKLTDAFTAVKAITNAVDKPVLLMTYFNPVMQYGVDRFAGDLAAAGGAGLITPDLIPDEAHEWMAAADKYDLDHIFLAAPSSTDARLAASVKASRGFVYAVSTMGITGARADVDQAARGLVNRLRAQNADYVGVGVGVSTGAQVAEVLQYADGAIVGSVIVKALADSGVAGVTECVRDLAKGKPSL